MLSYASQLPTEDPDLDDDEEVHGSASGATGSGFKNTNGPWSDRGRPYVYGQDDGDGDGPGEGFYDVGSAFRGSNGGGNGKNAGVDGTDEYNVEMVSMRVNTWNVVVFLCSFHHLLDTYCRARCAEARGTPSPACITRCRPPSAGTGAGVGEREGARRTSSAGCPLQKTRSTASNKTKIDE